MSCEAHFPHIAPLLSWRFHRSDVYIFPEEIPSCITCLMRNITVL